MIKVLLLLVGLAFLGSQKVSATEQPRGNLLELHSCELYAGGCVVSSEATLGGRYMLRVWDFSDVKAFGMDFSGLQVALLQTASQNLAAADTENGGAVVYLPNTASKAQAQALLAWLKGSEPELTRVQFRTRVVPMQFRKTNSGYSFSAGEFVSLKTAPRELCETGACGEALWYSPRAKTSLFTVAIDQTSKVNEPLLQLKWNDSGKRSVFIGKFGDPALSKSVFVSSAELCGPGLSRF